MSTAWAACVAPLLSKNTKPRTTIQTKPKHTQGWKSLKTQHASDLSSTAQEHQTSQQHRNFRSSCGPLSGGLVVYDLVCLGGGMGGGSITGCVAGTTPCEPLPAATGSPTVMAAAACGECCVAAVPRVWLSDCDVSYTPAFIA